MSWLDSQLFQSLRAERKVAWGAEIHCYDTVASTNDEALAAAGDGARQGTVWVAREQISGRGRRGNTWTAPPGECLTYSSLIHYSGEPQGLMGLSLVVGLALRDAVQSRLEASGSKESAQIKWPNDVFVDGKKLAGILIETRSMPDDSLGVVIGVGLNVETVDFPADLPHATSLRLLGVSEEMRGFEGLLVDYLAALEKKSAAFFAQDFSPFLPELVHADYLHGRRIRVGKVEGIGSGFDTAGRLLVSDVREQVVPVISGTVELLD